MLPSKFTIRVYGLLIADGKLLLSRENIKGKVYTKLPGGGLEFGEGTHECLIREFDEELSIQVELGGHFFTTDEYLVSAFETDYQVMSIYYYVHTQALEKIPLNDPNNENLLKKRNDQVVFWKSLADLKASDFDFPMDKKVIQLLLQEQNSVLE
jgi:8-oxo-dGTP diphosphatase